MDEDDKPSPSDNPDTRILKRARAHFKRAEDWELTARNNFRNDMKFANGDMYNHFQWPDTIYTERDGGARPSLTINKTRQHCLQIINDARQNKAGVQVRPVGQGASNEAAKVFEGVIRHIEYISNAQAAYDTATWNQVIGGIGWWRILTAYADDKSWDQEIFIRRVPDALSVYLDPDIQQYDGSDARWGFVFRDMPKEEFNAAYPKYKDKLPASPLGDDSDESWDTEDHIRVAEYYEKVEDKDHLVAMFNGEVFRESTMDPDLLKGIDPSLIKDRREITQSSCDWYLIAGDRILERSKWAGSYIPLVRAVGEETVIDNILDRKGHTRALLDPQRMYNYWSSAAVEYVALMGKTPYMGAMAAFEGFETYYDSANTVNHAWLPYNAYDEQERPIEMPKRQEPPVMPAAYMQGMQVAAQEMMMVSGQYQAVMGSPSNETSGKAINARQRQGDNSTYHYIDHLAQAIRFTGKILIDLIPKIYDTRRVVRIMQENGTETAVQIDPQAPQAHAAQQMPGGGAPQGTAAPDATVIFNPSIGTYEVEADVGPAYATQRQEAFNAFTQIMAANPDMMHLIGDLMFKAADFPMADDISERLHNMLPPQATGGPSPQMQQMAEAAQKMHDAATQTIGSLVAQLAEAKKALQDRAIDAQADQSRAESDRIKAETDAFNAETKRLDTLVKADPATAQIVFRQMWERAHGTPLEPMLQRHAAFEMSLAPQQEMEAAGDGGSVG